VLFGFLLRTVVLLCDNISTFFADYFLKASAVGKQNHWFGLVSQQLLWQRGAVGNCLLSQQKDSSPELNVFIFGPATA